MELIKIEEKPNQMDLNYEKVRNFKYLRTTLSTKNEWLKEINIRINKAQKRFTRWQNSLHSKYNI